MVVNRVSVAAILAVAMLTLAGCAEEGTPTDDDQDTFEGFNLTSQEDTGIIRGVVVDSAVVPISDATVTLGPDGPTAVTNVDGAFGFSDVEPGLHQVMVEKLGYVTTQTTVDVKANIADPPVLKILFERDPSKTPYVQAFQFAGYIECSGSTPAYRVAICNVPNIATDILGQPSLMADVFIAEHEIGLGPKFVQSEMIWESTQSLGDRMLLVAEVDPEDGNGIGDANGTSPLLVTAHEQVINDAGMDVSGVLQIRVFNFEHPATTPPVPVCGVPNYVHGGDMCLKGAGLTLSQNFEVFSHLTFQFTPPEGWQFTVDGAPVVPAS